MKPASILPDACVIIHLHELNLWQAFMQRTQVIVPGMVIAESLYYDDPVLDARDEIALQRMVDKGQIMRLDATATELLQVQECLPPDVAGGIHPGELEALALLLRDGLALCKFCSADVAAIRALVFLRAEDRAISLEGALGSLGVAVRGLHLNAEYQKRVLDGVIKRAIDERIQRTVL